LFQHLVISGEKQDDDDDCVFLQVSRPKSQDVETMESIFKDAVIPILIGKTNEIMLDIST